MVQNWLRDNIGLIWLLKGEMDKGNFREIQLRAPIIALLLSTRQDELSYEFHIMAIRVLNSQAPFAPELAHNLGGFSALSVNSYSERVKKYPMNRVQRIF